MSEKMILVVDDDPDSRATLCMMVEALGYKLLSYASGKEALEGIKGKLLTLAFLDIMMPEMNGYEVLQALRAIPEYEKTPMIMVTAKDQDSEILEGYKYGADYYIPKPFTLEQIKYGIKTFLDSK